MSNLKNIYWIHLNKTFDTILKFKFNNYLFDLKTMILIVNYL
jgi:hypothetical protein